MNLIDLIELKNDNDFIFVLNTFVDAFIMSKQKIELVKNEPKTSQLKKEELCILAASIHFLCNKFGLTPPSWVFKSQYICNEPYYAFSTKNEHFKDYLRKNTPTEFTTRNLFVGENAIARI